MALNEKNYNPGVMAGNLPGYQSGTGTVSSGTVTINQPCGIITTASLTTGTATATTFDFVNNRISSTSEVLVSIVGGTNTGGLPTMGQCTVGSGSATVSIVNANCTNAGSALNGTLKVAFVVLN